MNLSLKWSYIAGYQVDSSIAANGVVLCRIGIGRQKALRLRTEVMGQSVAGPPLRFWQRWKLMLPASGVSSWPRPADWFARRCRKQ